MVLPKENLLNIVAFRKNLSKTLSKALPLALGTGAFLYMSCAPYQPYQPYQPYDFPQPVPVCDDELAKVDSTGVVRIQYSLEKNEVYSLEDCLQKCEVLFQEACTPLEGKTKDTSCLQSPAVDGGSGEEREITCQIHYLKPRRLVGRRPDGLEDNQSVMEAEYDETFQVGMFFAELAYLESAAVVAFEHLTMELEAYNAPKALIEISKTAIQEEIEHAKMMQALANRFGVFEIPQVEVKPFHLRPLHEIAYENAREGCTRETFGALTAMWQSQTAEDEAVRAVTSRIAFEESRHAALSWAIDEWTTALLSDAQNTKREKIKEEALTLLRKESCQPVSPTLIKYAGVPSPEVSQVLLAQSFHV